MKSWNENTESWDYISPESPEAARIWFERETARIRMRAERNAAIWQARLDYLNTQENRPTTKLR
jgi:hypothetical protein